jgi:FkbM family methyltransferase
MKLKIADGVKYWVRNAMDEQFGCDILVHRQYDIPVNPPPGSVFIDIGCCHGVWASQQAVKCPNARIVAVDILPENCALTRSNLLENGCAESNFLILHAAVGKGALMQGTRPYERNFVGFGVQHGGSGDGSREAVPVFTLRMLLDSIREKWEVESIFGIKLDCEGGEYGFFESATEDDARHVLWFVGEFHNGDAGNYNLEPRLRSLGFDLISGEEHWPLFKYRKAIKRMATLTEPHHFEALAAEVSKRHIKFIVETGTGPEASGMQAAKRLGLHGLSCDVYYPCVRDARLRFPGFPIDHMNSIDFLNLFLPMLEGPTFFWLDGHCPTCKSCKPGGIFPLYEEMELIRKLKRGFEHDVIWADDLPMIVSADNPHRASNWDVDLRGERWFGESGNTWTEFCALFSETHNKEVSGNTVLRLTPKDNAPSK